MVCDISFHCFVQGIREIFWIRKIKEGGKKDMKKSLVVGMMVLVFLFAWVCVWCGAH